MNVQRDPDAILAAWLDEGPTGLPEPTRRAIAVNTRTTTQRRRPVWMPPRRPLMNTYARWAVAAIAVVLAIGGAAYFLAPAGGQFGGTPNATPSATPSSSSVVASATPSASAALPSASPAALAADGFVYPGTYIPAFDPGLTFTIDREVEHRCAPEGIQAGFKCRGSIDVNLPVWLNVEFGLPRIEISIGRVDKVFDPKHPATLIDPPADLASWISKLPGVTVVTAPTTVKVGGLNATQFDVTSSKDVQIGPIPGVTDPPAFGFGPDYKVRLIVVPVHGHQVLITLGTGDEFAPAMTELQPLVDSIVWH